MLGGYSTFFAASTGASAAFIGLLFVGLAIENREERDDSANARRHALSASSFMHFLNVFFVSTIGLVGQPRVFAGVSGAMAILCVWNISQVLPQVIRTGNWASNSAWRKAAVVLPSSSILLFLCQTTLAVFLLIRPQSEAALRLTLFVLVGVYAGALARAWLLPQN